ncbi:MAG TPA: bile acid:sodium symporter family protein [Candidatus Pseudogracilibacillus intestinigallinarum]|uniref:Bile acid:sodium symporter family protein n=1 Tax=Candidatus Pseudogracilibacillus intestinigallinarum TaxID=2838742 RepID=A0A9D1TJM1_9BACI|nr:bile acid:sodium symporter family protein [Candidatus Pseudogracilibacillus intestinigallinarum]
MIHIITTAISRFMPIWLVVFSILAYAIPHTFILIQGWTEFCLGLIFFLMGMSLSTEQIIKVIKSPKYAFYGFLLKWTVTVGISLLIALLFMKKMPEIASGIVLAGTVPSGTSANLYTFIAGGEVALSITMATLDTIVSPILTPSLMQATVGQIIPIDFWALFLNIIVVVFIPLFLGLFAQWKCSNVVKRVRPHTSIFSQLALFVIVLAVVSKAQPTLEENLIHLPVIFIAVAFQVMIPMYLGYVLARKWLKVPKEYAISICFHTGICNTALSATLATEHLTTLAAVPSVLNMIINLTIGAFVANYFERTFLHKKHIVS